MKTLYFILFALLLWISPDANAQDHARYSVNYQNTKAQEVFNDLESKTGHFFFYNLKQIDSVVVSLTLNQKSIQEILNAIQNQGKLYFTLIDKKVFVTKDKSLNTDIAAAYYPEKTKPITSPATTQGIKSLDLEDQSDKIVNAVTANKTYEIGIKTNGVKKGSAVIAGYVTDMRTGDAIGGVSIATSDLKHGTITNENGLYSLNLPYGAHTLNIKAQGSRDSKRNVVIYGDGTMNIELREKVVSLKEVLVVANRGSNVKSLEMGVNKLDMKTIKKIPAVFGEPDILKVILTLPGVQSVGEASAGFNVRGGSADQNLILVNDNTIYNPSHFFGFFSAFNPDIVKDIQLYKSTIPEKFGGRLASVLEVNNREGDKSKITGSAGIGLITSRLNIEGPIDSGKTSFILGARTTYSNWLMKLLPDNYENSRASFHDFNLGLNHQINEKNSLTFSGYYSKDQFKLNVDTNYNYSNRNFSLKWKSSYNPRTNATLTLATDFYEYNIESYENVINAYKLNFNINQNSLKYDLVYLLGSKHRLNMGVSSILYKLNPGNYGPYSAESLVTKDVVPTEQALESAVYLGDQFDVNQDFSINAGVRFSIYNYLGPQNIRYYVPGQALSEATLIRTESFGKNKMINTYMSPEFRLSARYNFKPDFSVKAAFNSLQQYIHLLSNTTAIAPTDVWKLSDPNIKPQSGQQISLGLYKNFDQSTYETSVEVYYKNIKNFLDYKSGANLVLNQHIETDLISTKGRAYGMEFLIKKNIGKLTGWMSYAYSRTELKMDDPTTEQVVNNGNYYPANYDKPHAFNFTGNYRFKHRYHLSLNLTYSTGRPITLPAAKYYYAGSERVYYTDRNAYRIPDYFRTDVSLNVEGNHKVNQRFHNSYTFGFYNLTGQKNPYSVYFAQEAGVINGYKLSIFASIIPFVTYNIKF